MPSADLPQHVVRFFDRDEDLYQPVADFTAEGVTRQQRVALLITAEHWFGVRERLALAGLDAAELLSEGEICLVDADEVLREITVGGVAVPERFTVLMNEVFSRLTPPYRVFGELVSLLVARGDLEGALQLEDLGHRLAHASAIPVLCAYDLRHVRVDGGAIKRMTACHDAAVNPPRLQGPVVLLADDFEDARDLYKEYLEFRGCPTMTAADGLEALRLARTRRPALIFLDIRMPRMSGLEAMQALRADPAFAQVPIVALTAHALQGDRETFLEKGFDAVVTKPCTPERLIAAMQSLLPSAFANRL